MLNGGDSLKFTAQNLNKTSGSSSFGRAIAFQAIGGQFEPGLPLIFLPAAADRLSRGSSGVEHFLGKEEVVSSILINGSVVFKLGIC